MNPFKLNQYDASNWDASKNFTGPVGGGVSQLSIKATNNSGAQNNTIQLFNVLRPIWEVADSNITDGVPGIFPNITLTEGAPNTIITSTRIYFDQNGTLQMGRAAGSGAKIEGTTVPYLTLCKGILAGLAFNVGKLRYAYTSDSQLDQDIIVSRRTIFGKYTENRFTPRSFFDPNQYQSKTVDIPINLPVDQETAIVTTLLPSEVVTFNLFIDLQSAVSVPTV